MRQSKRNKPSTASSARNCINKKFCPRCAKRLKNTSKLTLGLLNYYKTLCKSSKCYIHRGILKKKIKYKSPTTNLLHSRKKITRIRDTLIPCRVHEFEEDEKSSDYDIDPFLYSKIQTSLALMDNQKKIRMDDIIGHGVIKQIIKRTIIWPLIKPQIFKGLRSPPKGILLFGPPGTGKTLIGQWIASETKCTFFNISSSTIISKWMGESENLVRTLFLVAKARQPSVIFIDAVDSFLSQRTPDENPASRRLKNEFLTYMDGSATVEEDRVIVIGITNKPDELDAAARRRFVKRFYIPLPDARGRKELLLQLLQRECHSLDETDLNLIVRKTAGYSVADIKNLSQEAAMGPIKSFSPKAIKRLQRDKIRPISVDDFIYANYIIKPTVSPDEVRVFEKWNKLYGYGNGQQKKEAQGCSEPAKKEISLNNPYII